MASSTFATTVVGKSCPSLRAIRASRSRRIGSVGGLHMNQAKYVRPFSRPRNWTVYASGATDPVKQIQVQEVIGALESASYDAKDETFIQSLEILKDINAASVDIDQLTSEDWISLSSPDFPNSVGKNSQGDPMYTLGTMSFGMFPPTDLLCSIQRIRNPVRKVSKLPESVPKSLVEEIQSCPSLRSYDFEVDFTIEDERMPGLRGVMYNKGYVIPDPDIPTRLTVFFTGGHIQPKKAESLEKWKAVFGGGQQRDLGNKISLWIAKLIMGAKPPDGVSESDGKINYEMCKPIGGHGKAYFDVLYLDESMRVTRGNRGTVVVVTK